MPVPTALHWSGGKDSAHALARLLEGATHEVQCLVTVLDPHGRSTVHGLSEAVLERQAEAIGLPLSTVVVADEGLRDYAEVVSASALRLRERGVRAVAFGDLSASGAVVHHERVFGPVGLDVVEPLWGLASGEAVDEVLRLGIEARVITVDDGVLGPELLGRAVDREFLESLPVGCDPSGELGEYHTVVVDAPFFRHRVALRERGVEGIQRTIGTSAGTRTFGYHRLRVE